MSDDGLCDGVLVAVIAQPIDLGVTSIVDYNLVAVADGSNGLDARSVVGGVVSKFGVRDHTNDACHWSMIGQ